MIRNLIVISFMTSALAAAIPQTAPAQADVVQQQDVSPIYSMLMLSGNPVNLIAAQTAAPETAPGKMPIQSCVTLPPAYAIAWAEILAELDASKPGTGTIPPDLKLQRPYVLLNNNEVQEFRGAGMPTYAASLNPAAQQPAIPLNPKFQGATDLFQFSDVYFNRSHTIAVVFVHRWSGPLAAVWKWVALEKNAMGKWEQRPQWTHCVAES